MIRQKEHKMFVDWQSKPGCCVSELGKADDGEVFDPSTLDPNRCESCYGAETEDLKWDAITYTVSAFCVCVIPCNAVLTCLVRAGAATPVMTCGKRTGGEAGRSRTPTPSSSVRGRASHRRCRSRRTKAVRFTASWRSTRCSDSHLWFFQQGA